MQFVCSSSVGTGWSNGLCVHLGPVGSSLSSSLLFADCNLNGPETSSRMWSYSKMGKLECVLFAVTHRNMLLLFCVGCVWHKVGLTPQSSCVIPFCCVRQQINWQWKPLLYNFNRSKATRLHRWKRQTVSGSLNISNALPRLRLTAVAKRTNKVRRWCCAGIAAADGNIPTGSI